MDFAELFYSTFSNFWEMTLFAEDHIYLDFCFGLLQMFVVCVIVAIPFLVVKKVIDFIVGA